MKKWTLFCAIAVVVSSFSLGCTSDGSSSSWCRTGSLFPTSRSRQNTEKVYMTSTSASQCDPCTVAACDPCTPCNPCEPICNACDMSCTGGVISSGITTPHPAM